MLPVRPVTLADDVVSLEPMSLDHVAALWDACSARRGTYGLTSVPTSPEATRAWVEVALADQERGVSLPFVTRDARSRRILGSTRYMTIERWTWPPPGSPLQRTAEHPDAVEIGATWLTEDAQRTGVNTHAKLLMLTHAFEGWEVRRVTLKTDARNLRSRNAIERIGARFDGVLRAHSPAFDGEVRDTAFFSILAAEWPDVKARLRERAAPSRS
ncbi:MAG: GNAT family protein [Polyangiaceae bacterium]|jgi:RimJ/RimL family protein N-acetyltransferase